MPEGIGGRGENQARRTARLVFSEATRLAAGRLARQGVRSCLASLVAALLLDHRAEGLKRIAQSLDLAPELAKLATMACPQALDLPVELLDKDVGPHEEVLHQPAGDVGTPGQQLTFQLFQLEC